MKQFKRQTILLAVGIVLTITIVIGMFDFQYLLQDERYGVIRPINSMRVKRSAHTTTKLHDGRILICGGILQAEGVEVNNASTEIYDPGKEVFLEGPSMSRRRAGHTATLLLNGDVLIAGGFDSTGFLAAAEIFNHITQKSETLSSAMSEKRAAHTATLLADGRVLLAGGVNGGSISNQCADVYDPATKQFIRIAAMQDARTGHTATLLKDGTVLLTGGSKHWRSDVLTSCEIFDPLGNSFVKTAPLNFPRNKHVSVLLKDGNVLVVGGSSRADVIGGRYNSAEIFEAGSQKLIPLERTMGKSRFKITNAADLLADGRAVIAGDGKYPELFDPGSQTFHTVKGSVDKAWMYPCVIAIDHSRILVCGGYDSSMKTTSQAWVLELPGNDLPAPSTRARLSHFVKNLLHIIRSVGWPTESFVSNSK